MTTAVQGLHSRALEMAQKQWAFSCSIQAVSQTYWGRLASLGVPGQMLKKMFMRCVKKHYFFLLEPGPRELDGHVRVSLNQPRELDNMLQFHWISQAELCSLASWLLCAHLQMGWHSLKETTCYPYDNHVASHWPARWWSLPLIVFSVFRGKGVQIV
jgi:hypothetical protein